MQKMGWFGAVRGHSRSWAMPSFDRAIPRSNFAEIFGVRKIESLGYRVLLFL